MFADVSYDSQGYYYTDKGSTLKEKFEQLSDNGNKMWLLDLAVLQIDKSEIHDTVYEALSNPDLAKKLGFKKLFVEKMLKGDKSGYAEIIEEYAAELGELDRFDNWEMIRAFSRVMQARGKEIHITPYPTFCYALYDKANGLKLQEETRLIVECRSLLSAYDDFMMGLRLNQTLYNQLERQYKEKALQLQASYQEKVKQLLLIAENQGVILAIEDLKMLPGN